MTRKPFECGRCGTCKRCKAAARAAAWYAANKDHASERGKKSYRENRKDLLAKSSIVKLRDKILTLAHYGEECCICGNSDHRILSVDHIDQNGAEHRKEIKKTYICTWLRQQGFPQGYRTLCHTCNRIVWLDHIRKNMSTSVRNNQQREAAKAGKIRALEAYGGAECVGCGENRIDALTIDHIQGGGTDWRKKTGISTIYWELKRQGYPPGYRVLCWNCNRLAHILSRSGEAL